MTYNNKQDYYKCPECGIEVWPELKATNSTNDDITAFMNDMSPTHYSKECIPAGEGKPGGGSRSSKHKSEKTKKKSLATINAQLGFSSTR
jgi:hypothetical protein